MNVVAIIPARMASSRFPGKPLAKILGMPMIGHVYHRCCLSDLLTSVFVATCDREIADYVTSIGGKSVITGNCHERCTDRTVEALQYIEDDMQEKADIVLMVQGDEPMLTPTMIAQAVGPLLHDSSIHVVNLMGRLTNREEQNDPNEVKVVTDLNNDALFFSREPIPSWKKGATDVPMYKQVCLIPFRRNLLLQYSALAPTPLEIVESVDMLRLLEHGIKVRMVPTDVESLAVDTIDDLREVEIRMQSDPLLVKYAR